jgi:hypothetical protein
VIYVALQRARRTLTASAVVLVIVVAMVVASSLANHVSVHFDGELIGVTDSIFASVVLFAALVVASIMGTSLNRESPTLPIVWTKPASRRRIALEYFATDFATIVAVALLTTIVTVACAVPTGALRHVVHDPHLTEIVVRIFGVAFMWYAVVQAATAGLAGRGGMIAGLSWPLFGGLVGLAFVNVPGLHVLSLVLNVINPLAWLSSITTRVGHGVASTTTSSLFPFLPNAVIIAAPWLLAGLALYLATVLWSRREA